METASPAGLLTFGESMGLISTSGIGTLDVAREATIGIGGAESNVAIGVARLGHPVTWIGRLGRDAVGELLRRRLNAEAIDTRAIPDDSFTGLMVRHSRTGNLTHVDYHRSGSAGSRLRPEDIPAHLVEQAAVVHLTGITPSLSRSAAAAAAHAVHAARAGGITVSIDVNYRSKLWRPDAARTGLTPLIAQANIVFAGIDEAQLILETSCDDAAELARRLTALGPAEAVVKEGERGCSALIDNVAYHESAVPVTVIDPVGAGDAFVAGYLAARLAGASPAQRLRMATASGAYAVSVPGDCELLPTASELEQMLQSKEVVR